MIEIAGVSSSPRAGRAVSLSSVARRSWASPDANLVLLRLDDGLYLVRAGDRLEQLAEIPAEIDLSVAWDRSSAGFAVCWSDKCQARTADGGLREQWEAAAGTRVLAFSLLAGVVTASGDIADWRRNGDVIRLDGLPAAAAFRAGTQELWLVDGSGHLIGRDSQNRRSGEGDLVPGPVGIVGSSDGKAFFAINADRDAAVYTVETSQVDRLTIEDAVEGAWAAPGLFTIRLHESAKRPIAIWEGSSGTTGWMPVATSEVRQ